MSVHLSSFYQFGLKYFFSVWRKYFRVKEKIDEVLKPVSTKENKHGIGPNRKKIEPVHGLLVQIFSSSSNPMIP